MQIVSSNGMVIYFDESDLSLVSMYSWNAFASHQTYYARANVYIDGRRTSLLMHRLILGLGNYLPEVDHADRNGLNNCRLNLRIVSTEQQQWNKVQRNVNSGYYGVNKNGNKWSVRLVVAGKRLFFGNYSTVEEAARVYDKVVLSYRGEFAVLNFPTVE